MFAGEMAQLTKTEEYTDKNQVISEDSCSFGFVLSIRSQASVIEIIKPSAFLFFMVWKLLSIQTTRFEFPVKKT